MQTTPKPNVPNITNKYLNIHNYVAEKIAIQLLFAMKLHA